MRTFAKAIEAQQTNNMVEELQDYFVTKLNNLSLTFGNKKLFEAVEWERNDGFHGGGIRYESRDETVFNSASVNISQVHYDDNNAKKLSSATAISTIIHPLNPHAPSMHMHISWTQMRNGKGYFRLMADLNPSLQNNVFQRDFEMALERVTDTLYEEGKAQGERYFTIPTLERTRGVSHFYLENYFSGNFEEDLLFAKAFGKAVIDAYIGITLQALQYHISYTQEEREIQRDYHTLYMFQVLTLDRGTTSGLLIHNQNDIGIMGSIPRYINKNLLDLWVEKMPIPQNKLLNSLIKVLPNEVPTPITLEVKQKLANVVRNHYKNYPEALSLQASGESIPPTVTNHE